MTSPTQTAAQTAAYAEAAEVRAEAAKAWALEAQAGTSLNR